MEHQIIDILAWLEPRALLLALVLPPVIRLVGHYLPEELFMIAMGILAARSESAGAAATLLVAVLASHFVTDQGMFFLGRWVRPRLQRFPWVSGKLEKITRKLEQSPAALIGLIPARVFPLGRGAWLASCGVVGIRWRHFALVDLAALVVHLCFWCGLGWWLSEDLARVLVPAEVWKLLGLWTVLALLSAVTAVILWRRWPQWQPTTERAVRRAGRSLRQWGR